MSTLHYLAYGSNLHPYRLIQRVPNASLVGTTRLDGHTVSFSKRSQDGSSKCNLVKTKGGHSAAHVAIYKFPVSEKPALDTVEGLGKGYDQTQYRVTVAEETLNVFTYVAASTHIVGELLPYDWYKSMVVEGARYHDFPEDYIRKLDSVPSQPDPDCQRRNESETIVARLQNDDSVEAHAMLLAFKDNP